MNKWAFSVFMLGREVLTLVLWRRIDNDKPVPEVTEGRAATARRVIGFRGKVVA